MVQIGGYGNPRCRGIMEPVGKVRDNRVGDDEEGAIDAILRLELEWMECVLALALPLREPRRQITGQVTVSLRLEVQDPSSTTFLRKNSPCDPGEKTM